MLCKKNPEVCKAKIKCKYCIKPQNKHVDLHEEHDKIGLDIQEVDKIHIETDSIVIVK
jgi:hypothetical protein